MNDIAVSVRELGKRYRVGQLERFTTLGERISVSLGRYRRSLASGTRFTVAGTHRRRSEDDHLWALKDLSLDIGHGEVVGIIGANGAGKSTLLKVLSRVTPPTEGYAEIRGRVGSLLEVGTGFHPELTGRENIYLNGIILGMKRREIDRKFDEIVEFSEIGRYLDTPVKRYSSGMYTRLAFAVAAHLDPEILIVDEVLSVGDAAFQKKSLGRMDEVARHGRTILFVSHNLIAVQSLCNRVIWLEHGRIVADGRPGEVISRYLQTSYSAITERVWEDVDAAPGNDVVRLHRAGIVPVSDTHRTDLTVRTPFRIEFEYWNRQPDVFIHTNMYCHNAQGIMIFGTGFTDQPDPRGRPSQVGLYRDTCTIPGDLLNDGMYRITLEILVNQTLTYREEDVLVFDVHDVPDHRNGWFGKWEGVVRPLLEWHSEYCAEATPAAS